MTPRKLTVALGAALMAAALVHWTGPCRAADPEARASEPRSPEPRPPESRPPEARPQAVAVPPRPDAAKEPNGATGTATTSGLRCLTRAEQRARSAAHQVVPLAKAAQAVKARHGELLRARLCEQNGRLVYLLTVLPRGGKLVRATVDAGTGTLVGAH